MVILWLKHWKDIADKDAVIRKDIYEENNIDICLFSCYIVIVKIWEDQNILENKVICVHIEFCLILQIVYSEWVLNKKSLASLFSLGFSCLELSIQNQFKMALL